LSGRKVAELRLSMRGWNEAPPMHTGKPSLGFCRSAFRRELAVFRDNGSA